MGVKSLAKIKEHLNENITLYGISFGCPKMDRGKDCPLSEIEHLSFNEKIDWIDELDDEKKEAILTHHAYYTKQ